MNNKHKYFRNLRYKQKLEARYDNWCEHYTGIYFTTEEPDPRNVREHQHARWFRNEKFLGHDWYLCWHRPEVPYSIREYTYHTSSWKKIMKQQTSRRNRRIKITEDDTAVREKSFYKKVEDIWNYD